MRTRNIVLLIVVASTGAAAAGNWAARRASSSAKPETVPVVESRAKLMVGSDALNFGEAWETDQFAWTVPVTNQEPVRVEIESFSASCNCLAIEPQSLALEPGERRELRLQLDFVTKPPSDGEVAVRLIARLKGAVPGNQALGPDWVVRGRVRRVLALEQEAIYLGRHSELAQPFAATIVPVKALVSLGSLAARSDVPRIAVSVEPPTPGSSTYSVTLAPTGPVPVGEIAGTITLAPALPDGRAVPPRRVGVRGSVVSDLESQPPAIQVGGRRLGESFEEVVVVRSLSAAPLGAIRAEADGEGLSVEPGAEPNHHRIRQTVRRVGPQSNAVRFSADIAGQRRTVTVPVEYLGVAPRSENTP